MEVTVTRPAPADPVVAALCAEQQLELAHRESREPYHPRKGINPLIEFVVLWAGGEPVGCAGLQPLEPGVSEIKRMYVRPEARGTGLSRLLLAELEALAAERGTPVLRLETGALLTEAIALYTRSGFVPIPAFGEYAGNAESLCFEKRLG
ncbi:GNAT family N-acetyltransferase [Nonomuraea sp. NPDC050328]|uniref:GNAT family N-acetyltransferase n=1 Tax=Nonomuraea sp. NPDC050328 TaxID=3364361 RepID=UPI0037ADD7C8